MFLFNPFKKVIDGPFVGAVVRLIMSESDLIIQYYWSAFQYSEILRFLDIYHGVSVSKSTLLRRLKDLGLSRRGQPSTMMFAWNAINMELQGPGRLQGYRSMCHTLKNNYHIHATHDTVRLMLRQLDPSSVSDRQHHRLRRRTYHSHGPNDTWHIDGYDKLSPYGFAISGCIDGYSRRIIWLQCAYSNHSPGLIAGYFMDAVQLADGHPGNVRTDCGTENVLLAAIQAFCVRSNAAHIYGTSPGNQRIEGWWSFLRRSRSQWWIELFQGLLDRGTFNPSNSRQTECLRFCFMELLQQDLNEVRRQWNLHRIRPSAGATCPAGVPDQLYFVPSLPAVNCLVTNVNALPHEVQRKLEPKSTCRDHCFHDYLLFLCQLNNWHHPSDVDDALALYFHLRPLIS